MYHLEPNTFSQQQQKSSFNKYEQPYVQCNQGSRSPFPKPSFTQSHGPDGYAERVAYNRYDRVSPSYVQQSLDTIRIQHSHDVNSLHETPIPQMFYRSKEYAHQVPFPTVGHCARNHEFTPGIRLFK